jgi:hypothetical protein
MDVSHQTDAVVSPDFSSLPPRVQKELKKSHGDFLLFIKKRRAIAALLMRRLFVM